MGKKQVKKAAGRGPMEILLRLLLLLMLLLLLLLLLLAGRSPRQLARGSASSAHARHRLR